MDRYEFFSQLSDFHFKRGKLKTQVFWTHFAYVCKNFFQIIKMYKNNTSYSLIRQLYDKQCTLGNMVPIHVGRKRHDQKRGKINVHPIN